MAAINPNISLFHGENLYLLEKTLENWFQNFEKKHGDINITIIDSEEELNAKTIINALESAPFLGEKRLIVIKNFLRGGESEEQDKVEKFLENLPETAVVIFFENPNFETKKRPKSGLKKTIEKIGDVKVFALPSPQELTTWIQNKLQKYNTTISPALMNEIVNNSTGDMLTLSQEVAKLGLYCENRAVTQLDIDLLISKNYAATVFQFTDSLNAKNPQEAIRKLHTLIDMGEEILIILTMIARHFRLLILVKDLLENQKIPKGRVYEKMTTYDQNIKPYPVKLAIDQSSKFTLDQMKQIYSDLVRISTDLRTGKIPQGDNDKNLLLLEIEKFIVKSIA
mgnify:CR=1 FL=1